MTKLRNAVVIATLVVAAAACGSEPDKRATRAVAVPASEAAELLLNRNWIDVWPQSETEKLNVYRFVPAMGGGVFQDRTLFKGTFELFTFEVASGEIDFNLHHTKERVRAKFTIERVDGPEPFDLRLTISPSPRGPSVYYGRTAETTTELGLTPLR